MSKFDNKISNLISTQLPNFVVDDHPKFVEFLKTYYQFMEAAELGVTSIENTDGIKLENETDVQNNLILDGGSLGAENTQLDIGDKLILENSTYGKFTYRETITGQTSKATAIILAEDLDSNRLFITAQDKFVEGETILGETSNASAVINTYRPNPVQTIQQLTNFRDPDKVISNFLRNFRNEFFKTIPENLATGLNKRNLIKNIRSLYKIKGTQKGHELFFRILFNDQSETFYPREQLLKVSDGKWNTQTVLRVFSVQGNTSSLVGRQIEGRTSNATAMVESVDKFYVSGYEVTELTVNKNSVVGSFVVDETIEGTENDQSDYFITATITGVVGTKTITNDGNLYTTDDVIKIVGGGEDASMQISDVGSGEITQIFIDNPGTGYVIGDTLSFNNANTFGINAIGLVTVVNGAIVDENEEHVVLESQTSAGDHLTGDKVVLESGDGDITDIYLTNGGIGYKSLPTVSVTSATGTGASVLAYGTDIGKLLGISTSNLGINYEDSPSPPTLQFVNNLFVMGVTGSFTNNEQVTGDNSNATGVVTSWNPNTKILKLKEVSGTFAINEEVSSPTGSATVIKKDLASATVTVNSVVDTDGRFLNEKGHISETTMKIQDSLYYQDFSYVLKVSNSINLWRDAFKKTMHTSGFYFTGQVDLRSRLDLKIKIAEGFNTGTVGEPFVSMLKLIFETKFGRKTGTVDDGTILSTNPLQPNPDGTREVTLLRAPVNITLNLRLRKTFLGTTVSDNINVAQGFAYVGPRFNSINKWIFTAYGVTANRSAGERLWSNTIRRFDDIDNTFDETTPGINGTSGVTIERLNELLVTGTKTSLDGATALFTMISGDDSNIGRQLKTNFTFPADITFPEEESFSGENILFDSTVDTFDQTTV